MSQLPLAPKLPPSLLSRAVSTTLRKTQSRVLSLSLSLSSLPHLLSENRERGTQSEHWQEPNEVNVKVAP